MPVPSPRNKILPARGNYADLLANLGSLGDGEICYALDQDKLYVREGSTLVDVSGSGGGGAVDSVNGQTGVVVLDANDVGAPSDSEFSTLEGRVLANEVAQGNNIAKNTEQDGRLDSLESDVSSIDTFSGDYNDLSNKPSIPSDLGDLADVNASAPSNGQFLQWNGSEWVPGAASGAPVDSVNGQTGVVVLDAGDVGALASGDNISELTNNAGYITAAEAPVQPDDVFSGDYNDLTNKPTIPPAYDDTALAARVTANEGDISQLQTDVSNIDTFSGDYDDLTNKPSIPANTSDLVNDSGFITSAEAPVQPGDVFSGDYNDLTNKPTIPAVDPNTVVTDQVPTFTVAVQTTERTITAGSFDLSEGNHWTCGAITIPNPSNCVAGTSGLIRITAGPVVWGSYFKFPGGSAPSISSFPAVIPFYVQSASVVLMGNVAEGIS